MIKTLVIGLVLGATLGVSLVTEVFGRFGLQPEMTLLIVAGMLVAAMVVNKGVGVLAAFVALSLAIMQPEQVLLEHGFDRDVLLAALLSTVIYPIVQRVMHS